MNKRVYLDDNATTAIGPEALRALSETLESTPGNASSIHAEGIAARLVLERSRRTIERLLGAPRDSLVFTGSGSEANALGVLGALDAIGEARPHVVSTAIEHKCVLDALKERAQQGRIELDYVPVDVTGHLSPEALRAVLRPDTALVAIMHANNELGRLNCPEPLGRVIAEVAHSAHFHVDAVQALGRVPVDFAKSGADSMAISAHKFRGPKGIGGLLLSPSARVQRMIPGGGQERHLRAGTENVAGAAAMAAALQAAVARLGNRKLVAERRTSLWNEIKAAIPGARCNTWLHGSLPGTLNVSFPGCDGRALVRLMDEAGFAISAGSACTSEGEALSHVLEAICGDDVARARGAIRISFFDPPETVDLQRFVEALSAAVAKQG